MDIASLIVGARPEHSAQVSQQLTALEGVEVHAQAEDGRLIVTIESASEDDTVKVHEAISLLPGVMSVAMVYHQVESDPDEEV